MMQVPHVHVCSMLMETCEPVSRTKNNVCQQLTRPAQIDPGKHDYETLILVRVAECSRF